jgi:sialidase-1
MSIKVLGTGLVYRNPAPHVKSIHGYHPSVAALPNGELLATAILGEAFEAVNCHTHVFRSADHGETWTHEGPIYPGTKDRLTSDGSRISVLRNGEVVAFMVRSDRTDHPDEGLTSHETLGFVPTELMILRSGDNGHTWSKPEAFTPPLVGPSFELTAPILALPDGRCLLPTSTWRDWDGYCPNGMRMVAFISHDNVHTFPDYADVLYDPQQHIIYWETKIVRLADGRLLCVAWAYDESVNKDLPNQYTLSNDGGLTWLPAMSTGLQGQTPTSFPLADGRVLLVYRRMDRPGLWANLSHFEGNRWVNDEAEPIWGAERLGLTSQTSDMAHNFNVLRFGAPTMAPAGDGSVFMAFWCYEDWVCNIRWYKLQVN